MKIGPKPIAEPIAQPAVKEERPSQENEEMRKVARQFEAIFVNQMVGAMRKTVVKDGIIQESNAEKVYQSLLDAEYADKISQTDQMGLSQMVYDQLLRKAGAR